MATRNARLRGAGAALVFVLFEHEFGAAAACFAFGEGEAEQGVDPLRAEHAAGDFAVPVGFGCTKPQQSVSITGAVCCC